MQALSKSINVKSRKYTQLLFECRANNFIFLSLEVEDTITAEVVEMTDTDLVVVAQIDTILATETVTDEAAAILAHHLPTMTVVVVAILAPLALLLLEDTVVAHHPETFLLAEITAVLHHLETFLLAETIAVLPHHHHNKSQLLTHQRIVRNLKMRREIE